MAEPSNYGQKAGLRLPTLWSTAYLVTSVECVLQATRQHITERATPSDKGRP
jgi:hypothetical protein